MQCKCCTSEGTIIGVGSRIFSRHGTSISSHLALLFSRQTSVNPHQSMSETYRKIRGSLPAPIAGADGRKRLNYRAAKRKTGKDIERRAYQLLIGGLVLISAVYVFIRS